MSAVENIGEGDDLLTGCAPRRRRQHTIPSHFHDTTDLQQQQQQQQQDQQQLQQQQQLAQAEQPIAKEQSPGIPAVAMDSTMETTENLSCQQQAMEAIEPAVKSKATAMPAAVVATAGAAEREEAQAVLAKAVAAAAATCRMSAKNLELNLAPLCLAKVAAENSEVRSARFIELEQIKKPGFLLHQMLISRNITPTYELLQMNCKIDKIDFHYRVYFIENKVTCSAVGVGNTKKDSKNNAARLLIEKLLGANVLPLELYEKLIISSTNIKLPLKDELKDKRITRAHGESGDGLHATFNRNVASPPISGLEHKLNAGFGAAGDGFHNNEKLGVVQQYHQAFAAASSSVSSCGSPDSMGSVEFKANAIGALQELCVERHWPPPTYETLNETGLPHNRYFIVACNILNLQQIGQGRNKKYAMHVAAHKMFENLKMRPLTKDYIAAQLPLQEKKSEYGAAAKWKTIDEPNNDSDMIDMPALVNKVTDKLDNEQVNNGARMSAAQLAKINFIEILDEIGKRNDLPIVYVEYEDNFENEEYHFLVQLPLFPVAICHGVGQTKREAKNMAAMNALNYFKILQCQKAKMNAEQASDTEAEEETVQ